MTLPEILISLRTKQGVTQNDVAQALQVSDKTISKWENGASAPDLSMLVALAAYYHVSTDYLLGLSASVHPTAEELLSEEFRPLDHAATLLRAFEVSSALLRLCYDHCARSSADEEQPPIPTSTQTCNRSQISTPDLYQLTLCSPDANLTAMMLKNQNDFQWLRNADDQERLCTLFRFFSQPHALTLCAFLHDESQPELFTLPFIAAQTGIPADLLPDLLSQACALEFCTVRTAHLSIGCTDIYESAASGLPLLILTLANELTARQHNASYFYFHSGQMIGGKKS